MNAKEMSTVNASRLLSALVRHNQKREDITRLAVALGYGDPAQLETDIEDFVTEITAILQRRKKHRAAAT